MVVGIDLGTTNSAVAYVDKNGNPQIISNTEGERVTPSVLLFEDKNPIVGSVAKSDSVSDPFNTVQFVKRQMGNSSFTFIREDGESFTAEELSAIIIKKLKNSAEEFLGKEVRKAVVTVPAYFDDSQRKATMDAANIAGLEVLKIINEPTAAALAYGLLEDVKEEKIAVYDLGGGTFDLVIMDIKGDNIQILATNGDRNLGGFDFDNVIIEYVVEKFQEDYGIDLYEDDYAIQELREKAEDAKKILSNRNKANINLMSQGQRARIELTIDKFNEMIEPLIDRTGILMDMTIEDAGLTWADIDKTILVGGSTRVRMVHDKVLEVTGKAPSLELDPDEIVAMGAAIQAELLKGEGSSKDQVIGGVKIVDVNAHGLGVASLNDEKELVNSIILPKNTPIPAEAERTFFTSVENQNRLDLTITEGDDYDLDFVKIIGESSIALPQCERPKGSGLRIILSYDLDGLINLKIEDVVTGMLVDEVEVQRDSNLTEAEIREKADKLEDLEIE